MEICRTRQQLAEVMSSDRMRECSIGFVPTMGFLHEGHLSLVRRAREENSKVVTSIFVNPTQFGPNMDFDSYPRDLEQDAQMLAAAGVDYIFAPEVIELYPEGFVSWVEVEKLTQALDGGSRPGYFRGICTVVLKLFNIVRPTRAYFGQKDLQQALVVRQMAKDFNLDVEVRIMPIVRAPDGLALSSRNSYLTEPERVLAPEIYRGLIKVAQLFGSGETKSKTLREHFRKHLSSFSEFNLDYAEIVDLAQIQPLEDASGGSFMAVAALLGRTRLIDNILLGVDINHL